MIGVIIAGIPKGAVLLRSFDGFNIRGTGNRRFMYNPRTSEIMFGGSDINVSSHAQEWHDVGAKGNFDDAVRGWLGWGGGYSNGVIHFAPPVTQVDFDAGYDALVMFRRHGATDKTVVRNFLERGEHTIGGITGGSSELEKVASRLVCREFAAVARSLLEVARELVE